MSVRRTPPGSAERQRDPGAWRLVGRELLVAGEFCTTRLTMKPARSGRLQCALSWVWLLNGVPGHEVERHPAGITFRRN
jgi:hypothetical protein